MTFAIDPALAGPTLENAFRQLEQRRFCDALWTRRVDVWTADPVVQQKIAVRLGWLEAPQAMRRHLPRLRAFAHSIKEAEFTDIVLLGMGGASLASEVLRSVIGVAPGHPRFRILDSVDPDAVRAAMDRPATTLFILASKSGSTLEVTTLAAEAQRRVQAARVSAPGSHFVAITDDDSALHRLALDRQFRDIFINPSDVGGRFSALTLFGLVPGAAMGIELEPLLTSAEAMAAACRVEDPRQNPGLTLGAAMAAAALEGRNKLTVALPDRFARFGLWIEQLVAESTGKQGRGIVPIVGEASDDMDGFDRLRVTVDVNDVADLGAEFFCWEVGVATAGFLLGINPFDEPNVQQAKDAARALLESYALQNRLPSTEPDVSIEGVRVMLTAAARAVLEDDPLALLDLFLPRDYFALLAYLPPDDERFEPILEQLRAIVGKRTGCATMLGYGPRYLHSTGQLHKGGPTTGVIVIVTAPVGEDLPIPDAPYSFGVLELAQAIGDFRSLDRAGRRGLHVHLPVRDPKLLQRISDYLLTSA